MDRNSIGLTVQSGAEVALRKESVDRNITRGQLPTPEPPSLSARRAWIEIFWDISSALPRCVALRKESVDRNINIIQVMLNNRTVALRKESVDRNPLL